MGKRMKKHFIKEEIETANENMKRCSTSSAIKDMQIKPTMRYYFIPSRIDK